MHSKPSLHTIKFFLSKSLQSISEASWRGNGIPFGDITDDHDNVFRQKQNQNQIFKVERNLLTIKLVQILKVMKQGK